MPTFLQAARHQLADAALTAAKAAGAGYADLRIHRITTEIVQVRDGELETTVVNREVGLAVRVIVDGTWLRPTRNWTLPWRPTPPAGRFGWRGRWLR